MSSRNYLLWAEPITRNATRAALPDATKRYQTLPRWRTTGLTFASPCAVDPPSRRLKIPPPEAAELLSDPKGIGPRALRYTAPKILRLWAIRALRNPPAERRRHAKRF